MARRSQNPPDGSETTKKSPPPPESGTEAPKTASPAEDNDNWIAHAAANDDKALQTAVEKRIREIVARHAIDASYSVLILFDDVDSISSFHSDRMYAAASAHEHSKRDILLILQSAGGSIEPAYLIGKTLKRLAFNKFVVAIPRRAKSAATLISLGADEVHMGMMSQLGPVDPQLGGLPALALTNAMEMIADLACRYPPASEMFTKYLTDQIPIRVLGYYQRVGESAVQYAERLLGDKQLAPEMTARGVADHLVNHYKDHGFVIDSDEAKKLLGDTIVKEQTAEYKLADEIYKFMDFVTLVLGFYDKQCWYVGEPGSGFTVRKAPAKMD